MYLTLYGHACVRIEGYEGALVIDPGELTTQPGVLTDAVAVLITHGHYDHFDEDRIRAALELNPHLTVYTCGDVAYRLADLGRRVRTLHHGDTRWIAGFDVRVFGRRHRKAHPDLRPPDNIGFLIDRQVFHPGDALTVPRRRGTAIDLPTLLLPAQAPWMTTPDMVAYLRAAAPGQAIPIHLGLCNEEGVRVVRDALARETELRGTSIRWLAQGETARI